MSKEKKYYVYVHRYASGPKSGHIFYVGKGSGNRFRSKSGRSNYWKRISKKYGYTCDIVAFFNNEGCAFSVERAMIKFIGIDNLCNITEGGEGVSGLKHSDASREKMSGPRPNATPYWLGKSIPQHIKDKLRDAKLGKRQSPEHAEKSRVAKLGKKVSDTSNLNVDKRIPVANSDGETFESVSEAARVLSARLGCNASQGNISMVLTGRRKTAYGFTWGYLDEL